MTLTAFEAWTEEVFNQQLLTTEEMAYIYKVLSILSRNKEENRRKYWHLYFEKKIIKDIMIPVLKRTEGK